MDTENEVREAPLPPASPIPVAPVAQPRRRFRQRMNVYGQC